MQALEIELKFYKDIPGSIVHVIDENEKCFRIFAIFDAKSRLDAQKKIVPIMNSFDFLAVSFHWYGSQLMCEHNPYPKIEVHNSNYFTSYSSGHHEDDYDDDDGSPNWPSKTGNPSGGGRDNNSRSR